MNTLETLKQIIDSRCNFDIEISEIAEGASLNHDLGLDSLDVIELCMEIERELDIQISDVEVESWRFVDDVINTMNEHGKIRTQNV